MNIVVVALFLVGFAVTIDAADHKLPNGGEILSAHGEYIKSKFRFLIEPFQVLRINRCVKPGNDFIFFSSNSFDWSTIQTQSESFATNTMFFPIFNFKMPHSFIFYILYFLST